KTPDLFEAQLDADLLEREQKRTRRRHHGWAGAPAPSRPALRHVARRLVSGGGWRTGRLGGPPGEHPQQPGDGGFHLAPIHDEIDEALLEKKFAALKALGKFLANRLLDDTGARESDEGFGLGDIHVAEHREAGRHS